MIPIRQLAGALLSCSLLAHASDPPAARNAAAPLRHSVAYINDARSHGVLGDNLLSFDEVILLHNRQLTTAQLSPAEQAQIVPPGPYDVAYAEIDATATPVITVERDFDPIIDMPHGLVITGTGLPVIDFTTVPLAHGFRVFSDYCSFENFVLRGGPYGIDLVQNNASAGTNLRNVRFENPAAFGLRCTLGTANGSGRLIIDECDFVNTPFGISQDERVAGCFTTFTVLRTRMRGVANCIGCQLGSGGQARYELDTLDLDTTGDGVRILRAAGADRQLFLHCAMASVRALRAFEITGPANAATIVGISLLDVTATGTGGFALALGAAGNCYGTIDELRCTGDATLTAGPGGPIAVTNARFRNGTVTLAGSAQSLRCQDTRFDAVTLQTAGTRPVVCTGCCVVGGGLQGTAQAALQCTGSYVQSSVGANVTQSAPLPAAQLGSFNLGPATPTVGGSLLWQADLPPGLFGVFALGLAQDAFYLTLPTYPLHIYPDLPSIITLNGVYRAQQSLQTAVPNNARFVGLDLMAQMLVLPDPGMTAPWVNLPPGRRFVLR